MFIIETILLALALCVDSLVVSTTSAFKTKMSYRRGMLMSLIFGLFQGGFPLLGALLGMAFKDMIADIDHWVAFSILFIVGGKMIVDALRGSNGNDQLDLSKVWMFCLLGVATSIDAFVVGIGLGLDSTMSQVLVTVLVIGVVTFLVAMFGVMLGKRNIPVPEKAATIAAGIVLIALGANILIEHLTV